MPADSSRAAAISSLGAVLSVGAAMSCCLPTGALLAGVGLAGASSFFATAQPFLIALSALCLGLAVVQAVRARSCPPRRRWINLALLLAAAALVVPALVFPQETAAFFADRVLPHPAAPQGQSPVSALDVGALRRSFNDAAAQRRVIAMFSPT